MEYVLFNNGEIVGVTTKMPQTLVEGPTFNYVESSDVWTSFEQVTKIAEKLTTVTGRTYLPTQYDFGFNRFGIVQAPMIGDEVSYTFNGDYYPCGKVEKISKTYQVTTSDGKVFRRPKGVARSWQYQSWVLVKGHHTEQNPSF